MPDSQLQQYLLENVDKPLRPRGKPVTTTYAIAATSRDAAIAQFDLAIGAHHRELATRWSCTGADSRIVRVAQ
jgi:hypothetical protein